VVVALGCSKDAPAPSLLPPWQVLVTGVRPGHAAAPPALSVCEADGKGCAPIKSGPQLSGNKLVRMERGVGEFKLDSTTHVEIAEGSELLLEERGGRALELRSGGIALKRSAPAKDAGPLLIRMVDRTLELLGRTSMVAQLENVNRGALGAWSRRSSPPGPYHRYENSTRGRARSSSARRRPICKRSLPDRSVACVVRCWRFRRPHLRPRPSPNRAVSAP
jgi:hypothetical protein